MPCYDYKCPNPSCGQVVEVWHGMKDAPKVLCVVCKTPMEKQFGSGALAIVRNTDNPCSGGKFKPLKTGD